jgi:hypothetical protein
MSKGYRTLEPRRLSPLMVEPKYWDYVNATFHWLIEELYGELTDQLIDVELEVIRVERFELGYPAIGLHYDPIELRLEKLIEETCDKLLRERPISELVEFIATSGIDWSAETVKLMAEDL